MKTDLLNRLVAAAQRARRALHDVNVIDGSFGVNTPSSNAVEAEHALDEVLAAVERVAAGHKEPNAEFDGETYDPAKDKNRLKRQLGRVFEIMREGGWYTLERLALLANGGEASVSARLRDLRKPKFGSYVVEHKVGRTGLFEYRLLSPSGQHIGKPAQVEVL